MSDENMSRNSIKKLIFFPLTGKYLTDTGMFWQWKENFDANHYDENRNSVDKHFRKTNRFSK